MQNKYYLYLIISTIFLLNACNSDDEVSPSGINHIELGNPSNANTNLNADDNFLIEKPQFELSYNHSKGTANWVSWYLVNEWASGNVGRQDNFRADPDLPENWHAVDGNDYSGSGFDRGHVCPSGDRTNTTANNSATFVMTNIIPQAPDNNRGPWVDLEEFTRRILRDGKQEAYIIAGVYGEGGEGSSGNLTTIDRGNITVPSHVWKIIVVLPRGRNDVNRVNTDTRVIAVDMPNIQGIGGNSWRSYLTTVDDLEAKTGYDFLSNVPVAIQDVLEARVD